VAVRHDAWPETQEDIEQTVGCAKPRGTGQDLNQDPATPRGTAKDGFNPLD
jgi:hypothetical protein